MINFAALAALATQLSNAAAVVTTVEGIATASSGLTGSQKLNAALAGLQVLEPSLFASASTTVHSAETIIEAGLAIAKTLGAWPAAAPAPATPQVIALPVIDQHAAPVTAATPSAPVDPLPAGPAFVVGG
jgi:hypothetical protein